MPRFQFRMDPAWVTVGEGLSLAFRQWKATATWWAIPVLLVGILSTIVYWGFEAAFRREILPFVDPYEPLDLGAMLVPMIPQLILSTVVLGTISLVARWVYYALAVIGLRGGEITSAWVVGRGLRALAADLIMMLGFLGVVLGIIVIASSAGTGAAIILGAAAYIALVYIQVRTVFWPLVIFDGAGVTEGLIASWRASEGGVTRMIGWALAVAGVDLLVSIGVAIGTAPLGQALPLQSGLKAGFTEAYAVFQLFTLAVIYESQLRRTMPERASPPPASGFPEAVRAWPGYVPADPGYAPAPWTPPAPAPTTTPPAGPGAAWDVPPINPDAPDDWDVAQGGVPAPADVPVDVQADSPADVPGDTPPPAAPPSA